MKRLELTAEDVADRRWVEQAACRGLDNDTRNRLFFPETGHNSRAGKAICLGVRATKGRQGKPPCPVLHECLEYALSLPIRETVGIWGGTIQGERQEIIYKRELAKNKLGA